MNWLHFFRELERSVSSPKLQISSGEVFVPMEPYDLYEAILRAAESDEERSDIASRFGQYSALNALESWNLSCPDLLRFEWNSSGGEQRYAVLRVLDTSDTVSYIYICLQVHQQRDRVIAALQPKGSQSLYASFFKDLLAENGKGYHLELLPSLPDRIWNSRWDLVPREVVKESCGQLLQNQGIMDKEEPGGLSAETRLRKLDDYFAASYQDKAPDAGSPVSLGWAEIALFLGAMVLLMMGSLQQMFPNLQLEFYLPIWAQLLIGMLMLGVYILNRVVGKDFREFGTYILRRVRW